MDLPLNSRGKAFTAWKYDDQTWFITAMNGTQYLYLLEGDQYALLIDTAYGVGDLRGFVEALTDKPILTAITHGHPDHSGGCGEWEKIYMHPNAPVDLTIMNVEWKGMPHPDFERLPIGEGYVFDLGGRKVEVMDLSAHSNSIGFLDASHRLVFVGDEIDLNQVIVMGIGVTGFYDFPGHIRTQRANMLKLKAHADEFDFVCPSHNGSPVAKSYIDEFIALDDHILAGDMIVDEKLNDSAFEKLGGDTMYRVRYGNVSMLCSRVDIDALRK